MLDQVIGPLMGTNCAPLLVVIFLYESDILGNLIGSGHGRIARSFNLFCRHTDDLVVFNNKRFTKRMSKCNDRMSKCNDNIQNR